MFPRLVICTLRVYYLPIGKRPCIFSLAILLNITFLVYGIFPGFISYFVADKESLTRTKRYRKQNTADRVGGRDLGVRQVISRNCQSRHLPKI